MVKSPRIRHSKKRKKPVTIDLESEPVTAPGADVGVEEAKAEPVVEDEPAVVAKPDETGEPEPAPEPEPSDVPEPETEPAEAAQEEPAEPPPAPVPAQRGSPSLIAAGFIGALIALVLAGALQWAGVFPVPATQQAAPGPADTTVTDALQARIAELSDTVATLRSAQQDSAAEDGGQQVQTAIDAINGRIDQLSAAVETAGGGADPAALDAVSARVDTLDEAVSGINDRIANLQTAPGEGGSANGAAVAAVSVRIDGLEQTLGEMDTRIVELQARPTGGEDSGALDAVTARMAALDETVGSMNDRVEGVASSADAAAQAAAANESRIAANENRLTTLETGVSDLAAKISADDRGPQIARAIAAAALKAAIDRGDPFMSELETYASVADGSEEIEALRTLAATGVPTGPAIVKAFDAAAGDMIVASQPVPDDAGLVDRLMASARSLVKVRPVGMVEGDDVPAIIARIEVALRNGDFKSAVDTYQTLPEPVQAAGSEVFEKVRARMQADALVERTLAGALTGSSG